MKTETKLLLQYLFLYPLYYVVAMLGASIILYFLMSWSYVFTFKFFLIMAFIMGGGSYFIHWRIGFYALTEFRKS